jgi:hypothetical protein
MPTETRYYSIDGVRHHFREGTDQGVIDRAMRDYAQNKVPATPEILPGKQSTLSEDKSAGGLWQSLLGGPERAVRGWATSLWDNLLAGSQGVRTDAPETGGKLAPMREQWLFAEQQPLVSDPNKYFAAREPQTGKMAVYERTPQTAADLGERITQVGRAAASAQPERLPMVTAEGGIRGGMLPQQAKVHALLQDFERANVPASVPVVRQGLAGRTSLRGGRVLPDSPVVAGLRRSMAATGQEAERVAAGYGTVATPEDAGSVAANAARRFAADRSAGNANYGEFFRLMHGSQPAQMNRTLTLLRELRGRFPSAPGLTGLFTNPKLSRLSGELEPRTVTTPAKVSPIVNAMGQPIVTAPATSRTVGGTLTTPELRELRSQLGYLLEESDFGPEAIPKAQVRRVYAALTADMRAAAVRQGPQAVRALARATTDYGIRMRTIERLEPLLRTDSPESTFGRINDAARVKGGDLGLLQTAQRAMTPQEWGDIGAATIRRLGVPAPGSGAVDIIGDNFSVSEFARNWDKLSGRAKDILFGLDTPSSARSGLETVSRVAQRLKNVSSLAAPSRVGGLGMTAIVFEEVGRAIMRGEFPWATAAGLVGAYGFSKMMMMPGFTRWMYQLPRTTDVAQAARSLELYLTNPVAAAQQAEPPQKPEPGLAPPIARPRVGGVNLNPTNFDTTQAPGLIQPGNVDPWNRPVLKNPDGSYSTTSSMSIGTDQGEVLIPTVIDGKRLSPAEAQKHYEETGQHLGIFKSAKEADDYAQKLHNAQAAAYDQKGRKAGGVGPQGGTVTGVAPAP